MKILDCNQADVKIEHYNINQYVLEFRVNNKSFECFSVGDDETNTALVFDSKIYLLNSVEFSVFREHFIGLQELLFLWLTRPLDVESAKRQSWQRKDFDRLLNWDVLSTSDVESIRRIYDRLYDEKEKAYYDRYVERDKHLAVYLMFDPNTRLIKIGKSKNPFQRERTLQSQQPSTILLCYWDDVHPKHETQLHKQFKSKRQRGEWFALTSFDIQQITEYFDQIDADITAINEGVMSEVADCWALEF